ncbi:MAG TPA: hypothetical protein DIT33_08385 [Pseudomonas sp.]|nr:hypothetical protein [Pseudomonas sp.]
MENRISALGQSHACSKPPPLRSTTQGRHRRPMMAWWSDHIQKAATGSLLVTTINEARDRRVVSLR